MKKPSLLHGQPKNKSLPRFSGPGVNDERDFLIENLSMMLASGMPVVTVLQAIQKDARSDRMRKVVAYIQSEVEGGRALWQVLDDLHLFPGYVVSLMRVGEESGTLTENLTVIATERQKEAELTSKVRAAMLYPIVVLGITIIVGVSIAWFILPKLATVFTSLHLKLPWTTRFLIATGLFLSKYGIIAVPAFLFLLILLFNFIFVAERSRFIGEWLVFRFPVTRRLIQQIQIGRICFLLGTLLEAGIPIDIALESVLDATNFSFYRRFMSQVSQRIQEGDSFLAIFSSHKGIDHLLPPTVQQMIVAAEQSKRLPETFLRLGQTFEEKIDTSTKNLASLLEPLLLVVVWLGVLFVAGSVVLPIYRLTGSITNDISPSPKPSVIATPVFQTPSPVARPNIINQVVPLAPAADAATRDMLEVTWTGGDSVPLLSQPSNTSPLSGHVYPGETYPISRVQDGWYAVILPDGAIGWVSGEYVTPIISEPGT